jgi:hypothetical protein
LSKRDVCLKAKALADCMYRGECETNSRELWAQPMQVNTYSEQNLEYRNQLPGMCWGTIYCSSHNAHNWYRLFAQTTHNVQNWIHLYQSRCI